MVIEFDAELPDGGVLHGYDTGGDRPAVLWHHGTPNIGSPPAPLFAAADRLGLRWLSYDRPGYGGSPRRPGRRLADAAGYAATVADARDVARFAVMGHSGGASHALACAALLPDRVTAVVAAASLAPYDAEGLDWYAGMIASGVASLRAAAAGRDAKERHEASGAEYDPEFTEADEAALAGAWSWFGSVVGPAQQGDPGGLVDDDLAYVSPWGVAPARIGAPLLLLHGDRDGIAPVAHAEWLAGHCPTAALRRSPRDGHISVLRHAESALEWVRAAVG
ncbi:alpha/beta fold hydrolase [Micromonospora radicis]|uniref:Alpha/beta fold hydrolase n=1 Tax=Micromonospora radicis TaxID=1894971 RepID=A0A418MTU6_9ACTN|nr:alpha/beta fold hydrolase [Micromonospora radicis]RIV37618.1 alpha/beta fold hydrolase [Micromonospora radicis]